MPRFFCPCPLQPGARLDLPAAAARHVQVLRLQPGDAITLFNHGPHNNDVYGNAAHGNAAYANAVYANAAHGDGNATPDLAPASAGGEFAATITHMGRSSVQVEVGAHHPRECEPARAVHLAIAMPANERMDWLVEKATELGVASIQPLHSARSVLRLSGERADKKRAHWQNVAIAACEQCGGNRVPPLWPIASVGDWLARPRSAALTPWLLSLRAPSQPLPAAQRQAAPHSPIVLLCGPEGGWTPAEEDAALAAGFGAVSLGQRVLRSETAALAALTVLTLADA